MTMSGEDRHHGASDAQALEWAVGAAVLAGGGYDAEALPPADAPSVPGRLVGELLRAAREHGAILRFRINGVAFDGDVDLSYCDWRGVLDLAYCRIAGKVDLSHAHIEGSVQLDGADIGCLAADHAFVDGPLSFRDGECHRGISMHRATVSGSLDLKSASVSAPRIEPDHPAISLIGAHVGDLHLQRANVEGGVRANALTVGRSIRLHRARLRSRTSLRWPSEKDKAGALNLTGAKIGSGLYLCDRDGTTTWPFTGRLNLTRASCHSIRAASSGLEGADLVLDHFRFARLTCVGADEWLALLCDSGGASAGRPVLVTQPFMQLAAYCREIGRGDLERRARIDMQAAMTEQLPRGSPERLRRRAWEWSVDYGYRPERALGWLLLCALLCVGVLLVGGDFMVEQAPGTTASDRGVDTVADAITLSIDNLLPFAGLGTVRSWSVDPVGAAETAWMIVFVSLKLLGWGLAALGLAAVTGVMKKP